MRIFTAMALLCTLACAHAVDAGSIKRVADKSGAWLIEQFDPKENVFGSGPASRTPEQNAMVLKVLLDAPREHKISSGPYLTEPLKFVLDKINEDGTVKDTVMHEPEALQWIVSALKSARDPKYAAIIERVRARSKAAGALKLPEFNNSQLDPKTADAESMRLALFAAHMLSEQNKADIEIDGKHVKWAEVLGTALEKLQQPNGSFGPDIQANAMALYALEFCYKALK